MLTVESLRATVAAGEVPVLPRALRGAEQQAMVEAMRSLLAEHHTVADAARMLGFRSHKTGQEFARTHSLKPTEESARRQAAAFAAAGNKARSDRIAAERAGYDDKIRAMRADGHTYKEIAAALGLLHAQVNRAIGRLAYRGIAMPKVVKPKPPRSPNAERRRVKDAAANARRTAMARQIAECVSAGLTVFQIAERMRLDVARVSRICARHGWRPNGQAAAKPTVTAPPPHPPRSANNPFLTPAQQANVDTQRARTFKQAMRVKLPPPTREEADRAIAEFLARRPITVCASVRVDIPSNFGERWR